VIVDADFIRRHRRDDRRCSVHLRHQGPPEGINFIPAIIGAFAVGEILSKAEEGGRFGERNVLTKISTKLSSIANFLTLKWTMLRSTVIGTFIGILPGVGAVSVPRSP